MKFLKKVMVLSAFIVCMGTLSNLMAADESPASAPAATESKAPDLSMMDVTPKSAQESLKKDAICTRCHDESESTPILALYQTKHGVRGDARTPNCQTCHGESEKHLKGDPSVKGRAAPDIIFKKGTFALSDDKVRSGQCLTCHKGTNRTNWDGGQHQNNQVACNDCHKVHAPADRVRDRKTQTEVCFTCHKEQRADTHKVSTHPIDAGKVICSDCHNPHGSAGPKMLKKVTVTETCYTCHAEKRGPFLWEHQPATEDCTSCHTPHGSNISPLLKSRAPFLCQECHDGPHNSKSPAANNGVAFPAGQLTAAATPAPAYPSTQAAARGCMNCHAMVHGSNSPAGAFLHR
jgi:DmsE family decaheme c-type cytochrome